MHRDPCLGDRLRSIVFVGDGSRVAACGDKCQVHVHALTDGSSADNHATVLTTDPQKHGQSFVTIHFDDAHL